jgi:hypothetical protein
VLDPSPAPLRTTPRSLGDWIVQTCASWTMTFDNVSTLAPWLCDLLCRAVTGGTIVRCSRHYDDELEVIPLRRVLTLTTIEPVPVLRGDLADRILPIALEPIPAGRRRTSSETDRTFERAHPAILGAILDLTAQVLALPPTVRVEQLPRLADFATILAALDQATGWNTLPHYLALTDATTSPTTRDTGPETGAFINAIRALAQRHGDWSGTTAELADLLTTETSVPKTWLSSPREVAGHLSRVAPALREHGIHLDFHRERHHDGTHRTIHLTHQPE